MPVIRPIRELQNTTEISHFAKTLNEPIFITKNGRNDLVLMNDAVYERIMAQNEMYRKLAAAEAEVADGAELLDGMEVLKELRGKLGNAASSTFNSFMTNAARFYLGYIKARETEDYLSKTLLSIISARQERSDKATVSVLYALAVELNILQRILVSHFDIPDEVYAELRRKARAEVAVSRKGAQIESVQAQMFGGDTGWQSSSQNGAI